MGKTIEELLKAKGYADADLEALAPLLTDAKFRASLEGSFEELAAERDRLNADVDAWSRWHQETALPTLDKSLKDTTAARAEAAALKSRLETMQEYGLGRVAEQQAAASGQDPATTPAAAATPAFDPKAHNLVTQEEVARFAEIEGDAIAMAQDLATEYFELTGAPLRNVRELRREAVAAKQNLYDYAAKKFDFSGKRLAKEATKKAAEEATIRADERSKTIAEVSNPMLRAPTNSKHPFAARPAESGKQPWQNPEERSAARVQKALSTVLQ